MQLSPDGKFVAFIREVNGDERLFFLEIETMRPARIDPGEYPMLPNQMEITAFDWVSDMRVVYSNSLYDRFWVGSTGVDRDGRRAVRLTGSLVAPLGGSILYARTILHRFHDPRHSVLMLEESQLDGEAPRPNVIKLETLGGSYATVARNPGNVAWWGTDFDGEVRIGYTVAKDSERGVIYRDNQTSAWQTLPPVPDERGEVRPLRVNDDKTADVIALSDKGRWTLFRCDLAKGTFGQPLAEDPFFDLVPPSGLRAAGPVYSSLKRKLVGIRHVKEAPATLWLDPDFAAIQASVDRALPGKVNLLTGFTRDEKQMLVFSFSDKDPGVYYRYDAARRELRFIAKTMERIKPEQMSDVIPIKYPARDGLEIRGYLTVPKGLKPSQLPLVVMPHGGPWARDYWDFDPLGQMLASRGYAVLQMNFRGSVGYGEAFYEKGRKEFGRAVQHDIEDGTRWAIAQGVADPARVAILGGSFGGFCALFALGHTPDLYRCGISLAGVTDWVEIIEGSNKEEYRLAYEHWVAQLGDPKKEGDQLAAISPVNFADRIKAPVLLIHGREDRTVPARQARKMITALETAGRPPTSLFLSNEGHSTREEKNRIAEFKLIESFLAKHLKPAAK